MRKPIKTYEKGRRAEYQCRKWHDDRGWRTYRIAGSKGQVDIIAEILLASDMGVMISRRIQVKDDGYKAQCADWRDLRKWLGKTADSADVHAEVWAWYQGTWHVRFGPARDDVRWESPDSPQPPAHP